MEIVGQDETIYWEKKFRYSSIYSGGKTKLLTKNYILSSIHDKLILLNNKLKTKTEIKVQNELFQTYAVFLQSSPSAEKIQALVTTASQNQLVRVWKLDQDSSTCVHHFLAHKAPVTCMAFNSTGSLLATGSSDCTVKVFDTQGWYCTHNFSHPMVVSSLCFNPSSHNLTLASGDISGNIKLWNLVTKKCTQLDNHMSVVSCMKFSNFNGEERLISGGRDRIVSIWNTATATKKTLAVMEEVQGLCALPGGKFLTSGSSGTVKEYSPSGVLSRSSKKLGHGGKSTNLGEMSWVENDVLTTTGDFSLVVLNLKDDLKVSKRLVSLADDVSDIVVTKNNLAIAATGAAAVHVINLNTLHTEVYAEHKKSVVGVDFNPQSNLVASSSKDASARIWSLETLETKAVLVGHTAAVTAVRWSKPRGGNEQFLVTCSEDNTIKFWPWNEKKCASGVVVQLKPSEGCHAHSKTVNDVDISRNNKIAATASLDRTVKLWHLPNFKIAGVLKGHKRGVWTVRFSTVDRCVASGSADWTVRIWSVVDLSCLRCLEGHGGSVLRTLFIQRGTKLATTGADGMLKVWSIKDGTCVSTSDTGCQRAWGLATVPKEEDDDEGKSLITAGDQDLCIWEDRTEQVVQDEIKAEQEKISAKQELRNHMRAGQKSKAALIAIRLNEPYQLRRIFESAMEDEDEFSRIVEVVCEHEEEGLETLLKHVASWNLISRTSGVAQRCMFEIFSQCGSNILSTSADEKVRDSLLAYTERHARRLDKLIQSSFIVDQMLDIGN